LVSLGETVGEEDHALSSGEGAQHTHTYSGSTGGQSANHTHTEYYATSSGAQKPAGGGSSPMDGNSTQQTGAASSDHTHAYSGTTSNPNNYGNAHNNMQPTLFLNVMFKL
jgi:microcystin-dependent protein